jgi:hypothetical protein
MIYRIMKPVILAALLVIGVGSAAGWAQISEREEKTWLGAKIYGCRHDKDCSGDEICQVGVCLPCVGGDCWRSSLYPADWTPELTDPEGQFIQDFSYAGYRNGGRDIPTHTRGSLIIVTNYFPVGGDWTPAVQQAIDDAAALGGGVVYFPEGEYRLDGQLFVTSSSIVLKGAGVGATMLYFTREGLAINQQAHINFVGAPEGILEFPLANDGEIRSRVVEVANAVGLTRGQDVSVGWEISEPWVEEHDMEGIWEASGDWKPFFRRQIVAVDSCPSPPRVTLDVPLRYPAKLRDQASLRVESGYLRECGIEDMSLSNAVPSLDRAYYDQGIELRKIKLVSFDGVKDCWARRLASYSSPNAGGSCAGEACHLQSMGIVVTDSKRVTIREVSLERAQNLNQYGNGYLFDIQQSSEVLVESSVGRYGRHNFIQDGDFGASGLVFRDNYSSGGRCRNSPSAWATSCFDEFHRRLVTASLVENHETPTGWLGGNRLTESSGAGHTVTGSVYWRMGGGGLLFSWQRGNGYVIGTDDIWVETTLMNPLLWVFGHTALWTEPEDLVEGEDQGATLHPESLYLDQLYRRLSARRRRAEAEPCTAEHERYLPSAPE